MRQYVYLVLLSFFWGSSFFAVKATIGDVPSLFAAALRMGVALAFLRLCFFFRGESPAVPARYRYRAWVAGLFSIGIPFSLLFIGIRDTTACFAGIMDGSVPIWTFLLSLVFLRKVESFSFARIVGLLLGLAGIVVIFYPHFSHTGQWSLLGRFLLLLMAVSYAIGVILNRVLFTGDKKVEVYSSVYHQTFASFICLLFVSFFLDKWDGVSVGAWGAKTYFAIFYLGIFCTAIAWTLFYTLVRDWGAIRSSIVCYLTPPVTMLLDFLLMGTRPSVYEVIGVVIILSGVALIDHRKLTTLVRNRSQGWNPKLEPGL